MLEGKSRIHKKNDIHSELQVTVNGYEKPGNRRGFAFQ
jgi:hypothetical protein